MTESRDDWRKQAQKAIKEDDMDKLRELAADHNLDLQMVAQTEFPSPWRWDKISSNLGIEWNKIMETLHLYPWDPVKLFMRPEAPFEFYLENVDTVEWPYYNMGRNKNIPFNYILMTLEQYGWMEGHGNILRRSDIDWDAAVQFAHVFKWDKLSLFVPGEFFINNLHFPWVINNIYHVPWIFVEQHLDWDWNLEHIYSKQALEFHQQKDQLHQLRNHYQTKNIVSKWSEDDLILTETTYATWNVEPHIHAAGPKFWIWVADHPDIKWNWVKIAKLIGAPPEEFFTDYPDLRGYARYIPKEYPIEVIIKNWSVTWYRYYLVDHPDFAQIPLEKLVENYPESYFLNDLVKHHDHDPREINLLLKQFHPQSNIRYNKKRGFYERK